MFACSFVQLPVHVVNCGNKVLPLSCLLAVSCIWVHLSNLSVTYAVTYLGDNLHYLFHLLERLDGSHWLDSLFNVISYSYLCIVLVYLCLGNCMMAKSWWMLIKYVNHNSNGIPLSKSTEGLSCTTSQAEKTAGANVSHWLPLTTNVRKMIN